jgi:phosphate transport system permease protein
MGAALLVILLYQVFSDGLKWLDLQFVSSFPSRFPERAGIKSALAGTLWLISLIALFSIPVGVATAIYIEEFSKKGRITRLIELNISNLAGVPSIVYGIIGLTLFVRGLALERSLISGALTMSLLILPVIIIASREAIKTVPMSIRYAALALGATRWETVWSHVLPASFPGILTGIILSLSRAIGETAPLIMIGALTYVAFIPSGPMDSFTALPIQIFNWVSRPQEEFHQLAAAAIIVLLGVLLLMNSAAIYIRYKAERKLQ